MYNVTVGTWGKIPLNTLSLSHSLILRQQRKITRFSLMNEFADFGVVARYSVVLGYRCFGGPCRLHLQG